MLHSHFHQQQDGLHAEAKQNKNEQVSENTQLHFEKEKKVFAIFERRMTKYEIVMSGCVSCVTTRLHDYIWNHSDSNS